MSRNNRIKLIFMMEYKFDNNISETLLIPLYMRAKESRREAKAIVRDPVAIKLVEHIKYDYSKFDKAKMSEIGCVIRCWFFDKKVRDFVQSHINHVIVNVGCGLDARCQRTLDGDENVAFYSLDLHDTIKLRQRFIPAAVNEKYISASMFETAWMDEIKTQYPDGSFLFIIEGVVMYFEEHQLKLFFNDLCERFHGAEIWFDALGTLAVKNQSKHDALKKVEAFVIWGINDGKILETWNLNLKLIVQVSPGQFFRSRQTILMRVMSICPRYFNRFYSYLGYLIK